MVNQLLFKKKKKEWWCTCVVPATQEVEVGGSQSRMARQKYETLSEKQTKIKRTDWLKW
jgi:hypothetical protein